MIVTNLYSAYRFVPPGQRQLCRSYHVTAIANSSESVNQSICAKLVLLTNSVFRIRLRWESGILSKKHSLRRLRRCRFIIKNDEMVWWLMSDDDIALTNSEAEYA